MLETDYIYVNFNLAKIFLALFRRTTRLELLHFRNITESMNENQSTQNSYRDRDQQQNFTGTSEKKFVGPGPGPEKSDFAVP